MKDIHGIIMHTLAELEARSRQLRTQLGDQAGRAAFSEVLAQRGLNDAMFREAWDGWHAHFRSDLTKQSEVYFVMAQQHWADIGGSSVDETPAGLTPDRCLLELKSSDRRTRWLHAIYYARMARANRVPNKGQAVATVAPILEQILDDHDEDTVGEARSAIELLGELGVRTDSVESALQRCWARSLGQMVRLLHALPPVGASAPERDSLQRKIESYAALRNALQEYMDQGGPDAVAPYETTPVGEAPRRQASKGFPKWLLAPLLLALIGGGIALARMQAGKDGDARSSSEPGSPTASPVASAPVPAAASVTPSASARGKAPPNKGHKNK